jgi:pimeloyl-ACP methyl ester carboxylesterase
MRRVVIAPVPWGVDHHLHDGLAACFEGEIAAPDAGGSFEDAVRAVEQARAGSPAVVVGHSMASLVALEHARRHAGRVAGLVLVGGCTGPSALREGLWKAGHDKHAAWLAAAQRLRSGGDVHAYVADLLKLSLARPEAWPLLEVDLSGAEMDKTRMDAFFREEMPKLDLRQRLAEIQAPALVVVGREDALCTPAQSEALAAGLPRASLEVLDDCGHFPWHEQPAAFRAAVDRFLKTLA